MENEEFQKLVLTHFKELSEHLAKMDGRFDTIDVRLENIENSIKQHHEDTEKIAVQVEQTMVAQEKMQHDMNYLVRKTADHDDDLILLKKAK